MIDTETTPHPQNLLIDISNELDDSKGLSIKYDVDFISDPLSLRIELTLERVL